MYFTESQYLDFIDKHEPSIHERTYFTILTQHVSKEKCKNIREFCEFGISLEHMLDSNTISVLDWHSMPPSLQNVVLEVWINENRPLSTDEHASLTEKLNEYWKILLDREK